MPLIDNVELLDPFRCSGVGSLDHRHGVAVAAVEAVLGDVVEERVEAVVVLLRDRVVLVVVALRARDGQAEPDGRRSC